MSKNPLTLIAVILLLIGGLNWGLMGAGYFFTQNWNVVNLALGTWPAAEAVVYILVGLAAIWKIIVMATMKK